MDGTAREVKKVRKARDRRQEWSVMAYDKELRPDARPAQSARPGAPSEGSLSPDTRCVRGPRCAPPPRRPSGACLVLVFRMPLARGSRPRGRLRDFPHRRPRGSVRLLWASSCNTDLHFCPNHRLIPLLPLELRTLNFLCHLASKNAWEVATGVITEKRCCSF